MTVLDIVVDNEKKTLYMDNELYKRINRVIRPKVTKKDSDWFWIVDGGEGAGKSVFSFQLAKVLDNDFNLDKVAMTPKEFTRAVLKAKKGDCVVFDEGFTGLSSRASLTEINRLMVSLMMEMRQKNLFIIVVMPTIFMLDRYIALFRAKGLFHIYLKNGKRGRWVYFNNKKKKLLYIYGKKLFSYAKPRSKFRGKFLNQYMVNEEAYREKKAKALKEKSRSTKAEVFKFQRDTLIYIVNKTLKVNKAKISRMFEKEKIKLDRTTISKIVMELEIERIRKEEEEKK